MPRKNGEDQFSAPGGANVTRTKSRIQFRRGWTDTDYVFSHTRTAAPRECWLCEADQRAEVRRCHLLSSMALSLAPHLCPPMLRWQPHTRIRCHMFASCSWPDKTASNRKLRLTTPKECGCDTEPTILQIMLPSAPSPAKHKRCLLERQRGRRVFLCGSYPVTEKQVQDDESERETAQVLHVFFLGQ